MTCYLKDILELECFDQSLIRAGHKTISTRRVRGITVMEAPDIAEWSKGEELILTSLYSIHENPAEQVELVEKLAQNNVSGLIIKTGRFVDQLSDELILKANELHFPIIEIPLEIKYVDIMYPVMNKLFNQQLVYLEHYKKCHDRFLELVLKDSNIEDITNELSSLVNLPILVMSNDMNVIATSNKAYNDISLIDGNPKLIARQVKNGLSLYHQTAFSPQEPNTKINLVVANIEVMGEIRAILVVLEKGREVNELDYIAIETAATNISLELMKSYTVEQIEIKFKNELIEDLLNGRIPDEEDFAKKATLFKWDLNKNYILVLLSLHDLYKPVDQENFIMIEEIRKRVTSIINSVSLFYSINLIHICRGNSFILLYPVDDINRASEVKVFSERLLDTFIQDMPQIKINIGIGSASQNLQGIKKSYNEAVDAAEYGKMVHGHNRVVKYDDLGIYKLLCNYKNIEDLRMFIHPALTKLYEYDSNKNFELLQTLENYLENHNNARQTAEDLFIHYKTVLYRINRIKEIMDVDFENKDFKMEIEMGLKIMRVLKMFPADQNE